MPRKLYRIYRRSKPLNGTGATVGKAAAPGAWLLDGLEGFEKVRYGADGAQLSHDDGWLDDAKSAVGGMVGNFKEKLLDSAGETLLKKLNGIVSDITPKAADVIKAQSPDIGKLIDAFGMPTITFDATDVDATSHSLIH